jgi:PAS domain S-box-containing protein
MKIVANKSKGKNSDNFRLRQKAEELMKLRTADRIFKMPAEDMLKLIHELEVHQIELELQNQELELARREVEATNRRFTELYDYARSGFVTLSSACKIEMLNLAAAQMLGKERSRLIDNNFSYFVSHDTQTVFDDFFRKVFNRKMNEKCQVIITTDGSALLHVNIEGSVAENGIHCYLTMTELTKIQ